MRAVGCGWMAIIGTWLSSLAGASATSVQDAPVGAVSSTPSRAPALYERQQVIRERIQRLESRMLELARSLGATEPDKTERLTDALDQAGERRIKRRMEELVGLLRAQRYSDAEREQEALLHDLDELLELLTSTMSDADRRRAERAKLEAYKRGVRMLLDEQSRHLERTSQRLAERGPDGAEAGEPPSSESAGGELRRIEQAQRQTREKAAGLHGEMRGKSRESEPAPGLEPLGRAVESMQGAADRLGELDGEGARSQQQEAVEQLQQALDALDDALRQVRREELEETLTALEARFRSLLERERRVRDVVLALHAKGAESWSRSEQLQLAETTQTQQQVVQECDVVLRILLDEGSTVILPELMRQLRGDTSEVAARLNRADTGPTTQRRLDDIVAALEEVLAAVETQRDEQMEARDPQGEGSQPTDQPALLPGSAELKLLRSAQVRVNQRTIELQAGPGDTLGEREATLPRLAQRQRQLAELARRMAER